MILKGGCRFLDVINSHDLIGCDECVMSDCDKKVRRYERFRDTGEIYSVF